MKTNPPSSAVASFGRKAFRAAFSTVAALCAGLCSAQAALPPAPDGVVIKTEVRYLLPPRGVRLDLYAPANQPAGMKSPAILIIHGGGWGGGTKASSIEFEEGTTLAKAGYVCASIDYDLYPQNRWPQHILDCKNAVRFLRANAARYGIDPDRIGVIGESAGGHLALMTGMTGDIAELTPSGEGTPYPGISDKVNAIVDLYGVTDFRTTKNTAPDGTPAAPNPDRWNAVFGSHSPITEADRVLASPVEHIGTKTPPVLIIHGDHDVTVDRDQSYELDKKLTAAGVPHKLIIVPGAGHAFDLEYQSNRSPLPSDLRPEVLAFFDKYVKNAP